ncbi:hypothetical protein KL918_004158 [Ogataea parapolymorpha]|uniref:C2H2-type domain-containing protein n=1 Tax=Ogataea parapolymorpha (strain ATCC 26012 / BCRC 20466 / JCM 22074 / NRRL Y-7560 / DL-1) TaxID=871575 RepID=W1QHA3_OGAPD|nr:hypothetical protein HPODL_05173 [Ogataea parapolymorpha DL-1]ESX01478.1 hypothetical protein HPODL_05173 [Ogataea parapolymorpha DL-1]KAG7865679.1 hypothetical protein KL918_004158 [Ogataea parapolymorpha]KAG7867985.1 hypothetical protein KL916_005355 [Ogataea parapolymorpha]
MQQAPRKRGPRKLGLYVCEFPGCGKQFSRSDHVKRHARNHTSEGRFRCEVPGCTAEFTRLDIKTKHQNRHFRRLDRVSEVPENVSGAADSTKPEGSSPAGQMESTESSDHTTKDVISQPTPQIGPFATNVGDSALVSPSFSPSRLIRWMMHDLTEVSPSHADHQTSHGPLFAEYHQLGADTATMLNEVLAITPEFPNANYQTDVDENILLHMSQRLPMLEGHADFEVYKVRLFLKLYWRMYHSQYPILHRPSFSTFQVHPLLLLAMVMIGASFAKKCPMPEDVELSDPDGFADLIAYPLRWLIFSCDEAKPGCNSWVIQSLLMLETYEITKTSRRLHERACIYNGTKIQLLRRSPILGGDPLKGGSADPSHSNSLWTTWIESESMKRAAWMSFYIDTIHAVVYGHPVSIYDSQIKLSLPCPDDLWEYDNFDRNNAPASVMQMPIFTDALTRLLRNEPVQTGPFGRKILLAGLLNLNIQMSQKESQLTLLGWDSKRENWKASIASALDHWRVQLPQRSCCHAGSCLYHADSGPALLPPSFHAHDTRCKFPEYHSAQLHLWITHYDYIVYAGAPKRMNVPVLTEDYDVVVRRIAKWAQSGAGAICAVNSYILLFEMMLSPENSTDQVNYVYEPDKDPFIYRPNVIVSATLSLWAFTFYNYGPESRFMSPESGIELDGDYAPAMEDAYAYLRRIRTELVKETGIPFRKLNQMDPDQYKKAVAEYAAALSRVSHINYMVGLLLALATGYKNGKWEIGREYAKLLRNCAQRSMGSPVVFCMNMYEDN